LRYKKKKKQEPDAKLGFDIVFGRKEENKGKRRIKRRESL